MKRLNNHENRLAAGAYEMYCRAQRYKEVAPETSEIVEKVAINEFWMLTQ